MKLRSTSARLLWMTLWVHAAARRTRYDISGQLMTPSDNFRSPGHNRCRSLACGASPGTIRRPGRGAVGQRGHLGLGRAPGPWPRRRRCPPPPRPGGAVPARRWSLCVRRAFAGRFGVLKHGEGRGVTDCPCRCYGPVPSSGRAPQDRLRRHRHRTAGPTGPSGSQRMLSVNSSPPDRCRRDPQCSDLTMRSTGCCVRTAPRRTCRRAGSATGHRRPSRHRRG